MADDRLRELERIWRDSGTVEDEARYLAERVRCGDLEQEKLELAARLGYEAAQTLATPGTEGPQTLRDWARSHLPAERTSLRHQFVVRVALAALRGACASLNGGDRAQRYALGIFEAAERWSRGQPSQLSEIEVALRGLRGGLRVALEPYRGTESWVAPIRGVEALLGAEALGELVRQPEPQFARKVLVHAEAELRRADSSSLGSVLVSESLAMRPTADELVPWLLGYSDPVADRVKQREAENRG